MKTIWLLIGGIVISYNCHAQTTDPTNPPQVVPLSPNAAEFAKYGNIPVSESTGVPNISIPIYEINTGKIRVPISISYHASGIQVSQKATWVGLGWSLNAGGTISRSIRGLPDEKSNGWMNQQGTAQAIVNSTDYDTLAGYADNTDDSDPDFFSYSLPALSGRFMYSQSTASFQTIPTEPVKITRITAPGTDADNTYQITDVDGINYYYQVKQTYFNDSNIPVQNYTQSWYLSKIVSADTKDTVQFNYTTATTLGGVSEEISSSEVHTYTTLNSASINVDNVYTDKGVAVHESTFYHSYIALQEIVFRQGKVTFYANTPRRDYLGCMLDSLTVFSKNSNGYTPVYKYTFNHDYFTTAQPQSDEFDYRLRLLSMSKVPLTLNGTSETHQFIYNLTPLPSINSSSMDYWGYYNGTAFNNGYLPQILPGESDLIQFAQANQFIGGANRNESDGFIQAGMLQKIIYPTNGYTVFNYESHQFTSNTSQTSTSTLIGGSVVGTGKLTPVTQTQNFNWPSNATSNNGPLYITFSAYKNQIVDVPQSVTITDLTTGTNLGYWVHTGDNTVPYTVSTSLTFDPTHNYQTTITVEDDAPTSVTYNINVQQTIVSHPVKNGGGLRIASMQNFDNNNALLSTEKYTYNGANIGKNDDLLANNYTKVAYHVIKCLGAALPCNCTPEYDYSVLYYGNSGYGGANFEGANVLYGDVIKTDYDSNNVPNGKTEFTYNTNRAFTTVYNPTSPGGYEYIDNSEGITSLPASEAYYTYSPDGTYSPLKLKVYNYGGQGFLTENLEKVYRNFHNVPEVYCNDDLNARFTRYNYMVSIGTSKLASVTETDYNKTGPISTTTAYNYDNPVHLQITRTTTTGSDGKIKVVQNKYPADYTDATYGSDQLRAQSINNTLIEQDVTKNGSPESQVITTFQNYQGSVLRNIVNTAFNGNPLESRVSFTKYDQNSNIIQQQKVNGPSQSFIWGYNDSYPVAAVINAKNNDIFYDSFEEGDGNTGDAKTGNYSYSGNYTHALSGLDNGSYILSYWLKSASTGIWSLVNTTVTVSGGIYTIGGGSGIIGQIDDVRFYPSTAQMTTYTYMPLVGMTSTSSPKNQISYYEYDGFQRLLNIKDQYGNIVKSFIYHYQGQ